MAAVLCSACGDICSGLGDVCGKACAGCSGVCNHCCDSCGDVCANLATACATPFSIFVTVAVIFNIPSVYLGLTQVMDLQCRGSQWLFVHGLFSIINVAAAIYMAMVVAKSDDQAALDLENPSAPRRPTTAFGRAGHLLCYDPIMALYILVLIAFFCWLWTGGIWSLNGNAASGCDESVQGRIFTGLSFGWAFLFCGIGALAIGMCCAYCGVGENTSSASSVPNYGAAATTGQQPVSLSTPFVNADTASSSKQKQQAQGGSPVAAAAAASAPTTGDSGGKTQEEIPTVQATLF